MRILTITTLVLTLAACSGEPPTQTMPANDPLPIESAGIESVGTEPTPERSSGPLDPTIPAAIQGVWRESERDTVSAAECDLTEYQNSVRTLTIRADRFSQFGTGGRLLSVSERSDTGLRATFDTTYADTPTQGEYRFDLQDDGRTLIVEELGQGGRGPVRHRRCPS